MRGGMRGFIFSLLLLLLCSVLASEPCDDRNPLDGSDGEESPEIPRRLVLRGEDSDAGFVAWMTEYVKNFFSGIFGQIPKEAIE